MKTNKYNERVIDDILEVAENVFRKRNFEPRLAQRDDGSFDLVFQNDRNGLGSDVSLKILSQVRSNEYIATWASVHVRLYSPVNIVPLDDNDLVYVQDIGGSKPLRTYGIYQELKKPTRESAIHHFRTLIGENRVADLSGPVSGKERTSNPVIPVVLDRVRALYGDDAIAQIEMVDQRTLQIVSKEFDASIIFPKGRLHLLVGNREALDVTDKRTDTVIRVLQGLKVGDAKAHPVVEQLLAQKNANENALKQTVREAARAGRQRWVDKALEDAAKALEDAAKAREDAEAAQRLLEKRKYLSSLPVASDDHLFAPGKTEIYTLGKDEAPWKLHFRFNRQHDFLIENDNKIMGVARSTAESFDICWLNRNIPDATKKALTKEFISQKMTGVTQRPLTPNDSVFDVDGNIFAFAYLPKGSHLPGSLDLRGWTGNDVPELPDDVVISKGYWPNQSALRLSTRFKAHDLWVCDTKISLIGGGIEVHNLHATRSRLRVIEDGFKAKNIDLARSYFIRYIASNLDLDSLNVSGSIVRQVPANLTVKTLDVTGSYVSELRKDTRVTGEAIGLPLDETSVVVENHVKAGGPRLS